MAIDSETYYRKYGPMVLRRCRQLLGDEHRALDAMQDVFVKLLQNESKMNDIAPSALLFRMATNVCLNQLRSSRRRPEDATTDLIQRIACAGDLESRSAARSMLARLFGSHAESSRTIAVLHLVDGLTLAEVAGEVGMSVSGVRKRLRVLRADVRELENL